MAGKITFHFDDCFITQYEQAFPIFQKAGVPGCLVVAAGEGRHAMTFDQMMEMQMKLSYKDTVLINTKPQVHWWLTGFHLSGVVYEPSSLTMEYSIKFPDEAMMKAFTDSVDAEENGDATDTVSGTTVYVKW